MDVFTDLPWLSTSYRPQEIDCILSLLRSLIPYECEAYVTELVFIEQIAKVIFKRSIDANSLESLSIQDHLNSLPNNKHQDFLLFALIVTLCRTEKLTERLTVLLDNWSDSYNVDPRVKVILELKRDHKEKELMNPHVLGEAYHNQISRDNGLDSLGWLEYKRSMKSMQKGREYLPFKQKYAFMNELPDTTLGGKLCQDLRSNNLTLPGERNGFPEFFLWHDLSHILSGNNTKYAGELGANIFTAAYSRKGKFKILIWGLLQFNLDTQLAVVAVASKNHFKTVKIIQQYLASLLCGSHCTFDLLKWPPEVMIQDLKSEIAAVRRKYNIKPWQQWLESDTIEA